MSIFSRETRFDAYKRLENTILMAQYKMVPVHTFLVSDPYNPLLFDSVPNVQQTSTTNTKQTSVSTSTFIKSGDKYVVIPANRDYNISKTNHSIINNDDEKEANDV